MNKIIDVEALSKMPITKEFAELLFGEECDIDIINVENEYIHYGYSFENKKHWYQIFSNGMIWHRITVYSDSNGDNYSDSEIPMLNAFQIVRYIDNYLNSLNKQ